MSVNIRIADHLLSALGPEQWSREHFVNELERLSSETPPLPRFERTALDDATITAWIRARRIEEPDLSVSRALRLLRTQGIACEQKRFRELFRSLTQESLV